MSKTILMRDLNSVGECGTILKVIKNLSHMCKRFCFSDMRIMLSHLRTRFTLMLWVTMMFGQCFGIEWDERYEDKEFIYFYEVDGTTARMCCGWLKEDELSGDLVIPAKVSLPYEFTVFGVPVSFKEYTVTEVEFMGCTLLTSVTIPNTVTEIEEEAFSGCIALRRVALPATIKSIGEKAFYKCESLVDITLPNGLEALGKEAFAKTGITELKVPESVKEIPEAMCSDCENLKAVILHENFKGIGTGAFAGCSSLESINIQDTILATIGDRAFLGCTALTGEIILPKTVVSIGDCAFAGVGEKIEKAAHMVFRGAPPNLGQCVFCDWESAYYMYAYGWISDDYCHIFGEYRPEGSDVLDRETAMKWSNALDENGTWHGLVMCVTPKPIGCNYSTANAGELNISWEAFPCPEYDEYDILYYGADQTLAEYGQSNGRVLSGKSFSIWRSSETPEDAYDDFNLASNIAQHVSATNFIDKTFGTFKGTKPVKYWIELENLDDPDNMRFLDVGLSTPQTRIRPPEPLSCVTRQRHILSIGVDAVKQGIDMDPHPHTAREAKLFAELLSQGGFAKSAVREASDEEDGGCLVLTNEYTSISFVKSTMQYLGQDTKPGDVFFFFISTHGNNNVLGLYNGSYTLDMLQNDMRYAKLTVDLGVKFIGIINACHSGSIAHNIADDYVNMMCVPEFANSAWISCADAHQLGICELQESQFGVRFFEWGWQQGYALLSRSSRDGQISLQNIVDYVSLPNKLDSPLIIGPDTPLIIGASDVYLQTVTVSDGSRRLLENTIVATDASFNQISKPEQVTTLTAEQWAHGGIRMTWAPDAGVQHYIVSYKNLDKNVAPHWCEAYAELNGLCVSYQWFLCRRYVQRYVYDFCISANNRAAALIHSLEPNTRYEVSVIPVNQVGYGPESGKIQVSTGPKIITNPKNLLELEFSRNARYNAKMCHEGDPVGDVIINIGKEDTPGVWDITSQLVIDGETIKFKGKGKINDSGNVDVVLVRSSKGGASASMSRPMAIQSKDGMSNDNESMTLSFAFGAVAGRLGGYYIVGSPVSYGRGDLTITLNPNGGTVTPSSLLVLSGTSVGNMPTPTREKHKFLGWFTDPEDGTKVTATTMVTEDVTFYAHWEYDGSVVVAAAVAEGCEGMGTVSGGGKPVKAGTKVTLKATANKGNVFVEWRDGTGAVVTQSASCAYVAKDEDVTLTAVFATAAADSESLKVTVVDVETAEDGTIGTPGADGTWALDLGACVESLSSPKLAVSGLPAGLKYDAKTMKITGKATKPGVYTVKVTASNASVTGKKAVVETFNITVPNLRWNEETVGVALEDKYLLQAGVTPALSDEVAAITGAGWKLAVSGLPSGVKFDAKKGMLSGIATKEGFFTVYFTATRGKGKTAEKEVATATFEVVFPTLALSMAAWGDASATNKCKVAGGGRYPFGKKVTLKATPDKGKVFMGWYNGEEELVAQTASYSYVTTAEDVTFTAMFVTAEEDKASIELDVNGTEMRLAGDGSPHRTNIWVGVYLEWPVAASALSEPKVKVAGLPSGLKFTDKPVTSKTGSGKTAITVTNVLANTIYGAPTAASKIDKNTGAAKPSAVKITVTTAGKSSQTYQIDTVVDALPAWAVGTFAGGGRGAPALPGEDGRAGRVTLPGQVSLTVSAAGKVSGKALGDGLTYTLAAPYYIGFEEADGVSNFVADLTASWSYKEGTKTVKTNDVVQVAVADNGIGGYAAAENWFEAYTVNWKVEPWKTLGKSFDKKTLAYAILPDGSFSEAEDVLASVLGADVTARVTLKFAASGAVTVAGEFVTGYDEKKRKFTTVKASGSATLVSVDNDHGEVFIYLTPKGLAPHARCVEVPWPEE